MARKPKWPPRPYAHQSGQDRIRWKGIDYYLGPTGSEEAKQEYARLLTELAAGRDLETAKGKNLPTIRSIVNQWLDHAKERYSDRGGEYYRHCRALKPVLALFGEKPAKAFDADALEAVQLAMASGSWLSKKERHAIEAKNRTIGWSQRVVNRHVVRIKTAWRWLERHKLVPPGSLAALQAIRGLEANDKRVRHVPRRKAAEWSVVIATVRKMKRTKAPRTMLLLQWWCGMRSQDVRQLKPNEIDQSEDVWIYRPTKHKNDWRGQSREIALGPKCQALLKPWLKYAKPDRPLFRPRYRSKAPMYMAWTYAQAVRRAAERAGVQLQPYQCRHAAKLRITRAKGLDAARAVLGQKSLQTTDNYAGDIDLETAKETARKYS